MKVHVFIIRVREDNIKQYRYFESLMNDEPLNAWEITNSIAYGVYAWTTKKNLCNKFKQERSKKIFQHIIRKMNKSEYTTFKEEYADFELGDLDIGSCNITSTTYEGLRSSEDIIDFIYDRMSNMKLFEESILNHDIRVALYDLAYDVLYSSIMLVDDDALLYGESYLWRYDELEMFISLFGNTFSERITKK